MIISVALLGMAVTGVLSAGSLLPSSMTIASAQAAAEQRQIFAIENMTCALCPVTVKKAMEGVPGVKSVVIDFEAKTATVTFDGTTTTVELIAAAATNAGYPATAKS
jgi:mercuric ion binding protein